MRQISLSLFFVGLLSCAAGEGPDDLNAAHVTGEDLAECLAGQQSKLDNPTSTQVRKMMSSCASELEAHSTRLVEAQFKKSFDPENSDMKEALSVHSEVLADYLSGQLERGTVIQYEHP